MTDNSRMTNAERQARYRLANGHRSIGVTGPTREAIGRVQELLPSASMDAIVGEGVLLYERKLIAQQAEAAQLHKGVEQPRSRARASAASRSVAKAIKLRDADNLKNFSRPHQDDLFNPPPHKR